MDERKKLIDVFVDYNSKVNLSAIRDPQDIYTKHILDAIELNKFFKFKPQENVIDIGTGGGFPLLPLAITNPEVTFTGLDSTRKKIDAVNTMAETLGLKNVTGVRGRAEEYIGSFDCLTARAVAHVDKLIDRCYHLVKKGGYFILYKQSIPEEKKILLNICRLKRIRLLEDYSYKLFDGDIDRSIYIIQKV